MDGGGRFYCCIERITRQVSFMHEYSRDALKRPVEAGEVVRFTSALFLPTTAADNSYQGRNQGRAYRRRRLYYLCVY